MTHPNLAHTITTTTTVPAYPWNKCLIAIVILIFAVLLYQLSDILTPFLAGALLAYLGNPLVNRFMKLHVPRTAGVAMVFLLLFFCSALLILLLIPLIQKQLILLANILPNIVIYIQNTMIPWLQEHFGIVESIDINTLKSTLADNWGKAGGAISWAWKAALQSGLTVVTWLTHLILIPVVTFYLLRDWNHVVTGARDLLPRNIEPTVVMLVTECDAVLSAFFRGQLLVMCALGVIYATGLTLLGLKVGLIIGIVVGVLSIVPYLGAIIGILAAIIAALIQFGTWTAVIGVLLLFVFGQSMESLVLTPKLVGHRIGLHPVAVIFAVLAGGSLFGFFGVLLALPVAAMIMVLVRFLHQRYRDSTLYTTSK